MGVFPVFLNYTNGTKSHKASHIMAKLLSLTSFICQKYKVSVYISFYIKLESLICLSRPYHFKFF